MKAERAALPALVLLLAPPAAAADLPLNGITVGASIGTIAQTLGPPASVNSGDDGHRFDFPGGAAAYADDDGLVLAVAAGTGSPRVEVDGTPRSFPIGDYSTARADAELAAVAEFATATQRSFRLAPRRDLVLEFDAGTRRLQRVTYGEPGQLARLGLLPGDAATKAVAYRAPRLHRSAAGPAAPGGPWRTVFRVAIDRSGAVTGVDITIPSAEPVVDSALAGRLQADRYTPATLDGRPIAATIFIERAH